MENTVEEARIIAWWRHNRKVLIVGLISAGTTAVIFIFIQVFASITIPYYVATIIAAAGSACLTAVILTFLWQTSLKQNESYFQHLIHNIIDSEEFAAALRPTLPKGEEDKKYGFDYIPFLLKAIDDRRKRFAKSSRLFLTSTVILAITFLIILVILGYILVDENATGDAYRLREIKNNVLTIRQHIPALTKDLQNNDFFQRRISPVAYRIAEFKAADKITNTIQSSINSYISSADLGGLQASLPAWIQLQEKNTDFVQQLKNLQATMKEFSDNRSVAEYFIQQSVEALKQDIASATTAVETNRTNELLKRLAIGLIIASFFLAILRYMASLYRDHHSQMVQAEQDDMSVRRFYIAFRCATNDPNQRTHILENFVSVQPNGTFGKESATDFTPQTQDLVKDILTAIAKRAGA